MQHQYILLIAKVRFSSKTATDQVSNEHFHLLLGNCNIFSGTLQGDLVFPFCKLNVHLQRPQ